MHIIPGCNEADHQQDAAINDFPPEALLLFLFCQSLPSFLPAAMAELSRCSDPVNRSVFPAETPDSSWHHDLPVLGTGIGWNLLFQFCQYTMMISFIESGWGNCLIPVKNGLQAWLFFLKPGSDQAGKKPRKA